MEYQLLLEKIKRKAPFYELHGNQNLNCNLVDIRITTKQQIRFKESTLYLSTTSQLPDCTITDSFTVFCYGEAVDFSCYNDAAFCITYFGPEISQADLFNMVIENLKETPQVSIGMHLLMNALFSGKGLQHLVDTAADVFDNPVYVVDLQHKYLAISSGIFPDNAFFKKEQESPYIREEGVLYIRKNHIDEKVRKSVLPIYFFNEIARHGTLISSITIDGIEVGHIMIQESEHKFKETDAELLFNFSSLVSMELQKSPVFHDNKGIMYSYFLADLLKNSDSNTATIKKRMDTLGFKLKSNLYIMAIPSSSYHTSTLRLEVILQSIKYILPESLYVIYENSIVFLITKDAYQTFSQYELDRLTDFLKSNGLKAGISNFFKELSDAPRFYKQALDALKLGAHLKENLPIYYYKDYYIYHMLSTLEKDGNELRYLIHPGLMQLYLYDKEKETELIHTLQEYLKSPGYPSKVAENLHIHKNTFLYRMKKIREITSCEFVTGEDYMAFNFSIKIMSYLHML